MLVNIISWILGPYHLHHDRNFENPEQQIFSYKQSNITLSLAFLLDCHCLCEYERGLNWRRKNKQRGFSRRTDMIVREPLFGHFLNTQRMSFIFLQARCAIPVSRLAIIKLPRKEDECDHPFKNTHTNPCYYFNGHVKSEKEWHNKIFQQTLRTDQSKMWGVINTHTQVVFV